MTNFFPHTQMTALEDTKHFVFDSWVNQIVKMKFLLLAIVGHVKCAGKKQMQALNLILVCIFSYCCSHLYITA